MDKIELERAAAFINETEDQARLEAFIKQFGNSPYAKIARARLEQLRKQAALVPARCDGVETQVGSERRCLKAKDSFRDCSNCPEMVLVPAGTFTMGSLDHASS